MSTLNLVAFGFAAWCAANAALVLVFALAAFRHRPHRRRPYRIHHR